ncbi:hypothetical protein Nepgr_017250 [Nepenthes gracilis]|uniref:Endoglucanase n=1 Tax=Nepenthes gracilis TaxID=150966 RepID=A0AAD3SR44_NEPGR|nr:hypothetical protein Nepgr_017250 [Nepenthes gracilis]
MAAIRLLYLSFFILPLLLLLRVVSSADNSAALTKSLLYYEAQRSGKLPDNQRVQWRGDSALKDGTNDVQLVGGYYDAGDNVKFGLPMAYTITMLAWGVVEYGSKFEANNELQNALDAIRWGTDYLLRAHSEPNVLFAGVGDPVADHDCWERPEDMGTPRTVYKVDEEHPGSDLAGETAAALAAGFIVFTERDRDYAAKLLSHSRQIFDFAINHQGKYSDSIPAVGKFYSSSGFQDELLWAAAWLLRATADEEYMNYLDDADDTGGARSMFSWDDKYVGAQILAAKNVLDGDVEDSGNWAGFKDQAEEYICNCVQKGNNNVVKTSGGLLWFNEWANLQYTASASLAMVIYSDYLRVSGNALSCPSGLVNPDDLIAFAKSQVEYILGANPRNMSYMVGFGSNYPQKVHHRGSSIVSIKKDPTKVGCKDGYTNWYSKNEPNPNVLDGAIVGGPDKSDNYNDDRGNFQQAEPAIATVAPLVGVLARISS